ncbi:protein B4 [Anguilla rostrata]|uniref:H15 domain-containing protein n=1 Tax=Anguilla anguilla TaxID=7936 RepID=A0A9D3LRX8_ANGAN|nr:protein B4 [Anguilla anguilla]KAG5835910.1 hypothetical protein ANANG_G00249010 [Anguilla anguilla]
MPPKKTASFEVPDPGQPSTDVSKKGVKNSEKLKLDVAGESSKVAVTRKVSTHPSTMEMVKEALKALDTRKGLSAQAIRGYILEKYPSVDAVRLKYMLRKALTKGLEVGTLVRPANSTGNGAQGRFRLAVRGKTKEPKGTENSDPNVEKSKVETKSKGTGSKKTKPVPKKLKDEDSGSTEALASKVAPAKKPKAAKEGAKKAAAKTKVATVPKARNAKSLANQLEGEGEAAAKKPGKRGKNAQ